jgi:outer membrane lipoprotein-sorting protein
MTAMVIFSTVLNVCCDGQEQKISAAVNATTANEIPPASKVERPVTSEKNKELDDILENMQKQLTQLKTYQAMIEYLFIQDPEMLDSRILQKGLIYYAKDEKGSRIRIDFNTRKQDDGEQENYLEQYFFDGVWLVRINHKLEQADYYQQAEEDKPIDVFEFISHNFPMVGFTGPEHLRKQFEINLLQDCKTESDDSFHLFLKVKKDSVYKDDYEQIDFWVNKKVFLPRKMLATSLNGDIYDIVFLDNKVNKNLKNGIFTVETPKHFGKNIKPFERK